jgi:hypothetical protein
MDRALILFSSPMDHDPLRLSVEHRDIEKTLLRHGVETSRYTIKHAVTMRDFIDCLCAHPYDVLQFSGHGNENIFYFETDEGLAEAVTGDRLSEILRKALPNLQICIFSCCYSAESIESLYKVASWIISLFGEANDDAAREFVCRFYSAYIGSNSVENAFQLAQWSMEGKIKALLTRRAFKEQNSRAYLQCFTKKNHEPIIVDVEEVYRQKDRFDEPLEEILHNISIKIGIHSDLLFGTPQSNAVLTVGKYIGIFSWKNRFDPIKVKKLMRIKQSISLQTCNLLTRLAVKYNHAAKASYRKNPTPADIKGKNELGRDLNSLERWLREILSEPTSTHFQRDLLEQYIVSVATISANLSMAQESFDSDKLPDLIVYMEIALSAFHDLLNALIKVVSDA